jgi:hypothetical protein
MSSSDILKDLINTYGTLGKEKMIKLLMIFLKIIRI